MGQERVAGVRNPNLGQGWVGGFILQQPWLASTQVQGQRAGHCEAKSLGQTVQQALQLVDAILLFYLCNSCTIPHYTMCNVGGASISEEKTEHGAEHFRFVGSLLVVILQ